MRFVKWADVKITVINFCEAWHQLCYPKTNFRNFGCNTVFLRNDYVIK